MIWRRLWFHFLRRIVLPIAIVPFRLLVASWAKHPPEDAVVARIAASPRVVLVTWHGMFLELLAFARIFERYGRSLVVLTAPSLDGRLLADLLARFGLAHVPGTTGSHGVGGSLAFLRRIEAGDIGLIAADGPRGPAFVAKPGLVRLMAAARAEPIAAVTSSGTGLAFASWDRARLPAPFTRVELVLEPIQSSAEGKPLSVGDALFANARRIGSRVIPPRS